MILTIRVYLWFKNSKFEYRYSYRCVYGEKRGSSVSGESLCICHAPAMNPLFGRVVYFVFLSVILNGKRLVRFSWLLFFIWTPVTLGVYLYLPIYYYTSWALRTHTNRFGSYNLIYIYIILYTPYIYVNIWYNIL